MIISGNPVCTIMSENKKRETEVKDAEMENMKLDTELKRLEIEERKLRIEKIKNNTPNK